MIHSFPMQTRTQCFRGPAFAGRILRAFLVAAGFSFFILPLGAGVYRNSIAPGTVPWPGGVVPYAWDVSVPVPLRATYLAGLREWEMAANIHFILRTSEATYLRLAYDPIAPSGSYTASPPTLTMVNLSRRLVCHESGHALGLEHEHQRPDRDSSITVFLANIIDSAEFKFANYLVSEATTNGAYDFESVMHYQRTEYSIDPANLSSMLPKPPNDVLFFNRLSNFALSAGDRATVAFLYGAGPVLSSVVTNTQDTGTGSLRAAIYYANEHPGTTITFAIPNSDPGFSGGAYTIRLTGSLPPLVANATTINGASQPGYAGTPVIALSGESLIPEAKDVNGMMIFAANCRVRALAIHGFSDNGVAMFHRGATGNIVEGCHIGVKPDGTTASANKRQGVAIWGGAQNNRIGTDGTASATRNVISGNTEYGVLVLESGTTGNRISGNYIGTNAAGTAALPNAKSGVAVWGTATGNQIGGLTNAERNVLSGNAEYGVLISDAGTTNNVVLGNYIGTNSAGAAAIGNSFGGVIIYQGANGNSLGRGNVISGNSSYGVLIIGAAGNSVVGNLIGLNASGTAALGNARTGVAVWGAATNNLIGGSAPAARNYIAGNFNYGLIILDANTTGNVVAGNCIGLKPDGSSAGNAFAGVAFWGGSRGNRVGGGSGEGNMITSSGWDGVALYDTATMENSILGNQISGNGGVGIGVWTGTGIAAPTITGASIGTATQVAGTFTLSGAGYHRIEFFANPAGGDEGRHFIGAVASNTGSFTVNLPAMIPSGYNVTATVTVPAGDTSPLSFPFTPTFTDTDIDGMPNAYETANGLVNGINDATNDADGDGQTNIAEMFAGTNPRSTLSRFKPLRIVTTPTGADVILDNPAPGRFWRFEVSDDFVAWQTLAFGLFDSPTDSDPGQIAVTDSLALGRPRRFYRAVIEP